MLFAQALELLMQGQKVARKSWTEEMGYLILLSGMDYIWKILTKPGPNAGNHIFSAAELAADDWEVVSGANVASPEPVGCAA